MCISDLVRKINLCLKDDKFPLPGMDELFEKLGKGYRVFSKIDLKSAYHQIPLDYKSQELTTIVTPMGMYRYKRMPFAIKSAPIAF